MPAKRRNDPRFKSYVGRVFTLRKTSHIPSYNKNNFPGRRLPREEFGDAVLVIDETNTRVRVCMTNGRFSWISKYYLHNEIKVSIFDDIDTLTSSIFSLLKIAQNVKSLELAQGSCFGFAEELELVANDLRNYADKFLAKENE